MRTALVFLNSIFYLEMQEQNKWVRQHTLYCITCSLTNTSDILINRLIYVDKKNQLDVTFCILYFSSNSCSTCFGQPCAHHQEPTTA